MNSIESLVAASHENFDLTSQSDQKRLMELTERLLDSKTGIQELKKTARQAPLEFRLAVMLAESRYILQGIGQPVSIGIVFAMWGEHNRLKPKSAGNPHGEDSLRTKLSQLDWITRGTRVDWHLYAVDDGDPMNSGTIARDMIHGHPLEHRVSVLHLADLLPAEDGPLRGLGTPDDSRKGGAIICGSMKAISDGVDAVIYTDADNSVHLGQIGLLLGPFIGQQVRVVLGTRKHEDAVLVKQEARWGIGIKLLRHMQRMVGSPIFSRGIKDTQAAFKLYQSGLLKRIISDSTLYDFSFDTDWILAAIKMGEPYVLVPFAFIDSASESASATQGPMTTWEVLLQGLKASVRKHGLPHNEEMARVLDEEIKSSADLDILIDHLPPELEDATDAQLGDPAIMSPAAVRVWIRQRKLQTA